MSLVVVLDEHPSGPRDALVHTIDAEFSRSDLTARVDALTDRLRQADVDAGMPVAVIADGVEMLVGMFAAWECDAVFVPVNPRQPSAAIDDLLARTDPAAVVDGGTATPRASTTIHEPDTAFVLWTSGTTGRPKPVLHTHTAYLELIDRVLVPLRGGSRPPSARRSPNLIPVSMALNAGIYNALFGLRAGAPLVIMEGFDPSSFATLVARHEIRSTVLPPAAMAMLVDAPDVVDLTPLRYVRSITAPLSPFQAHRFRDVFDVVVLNGYGQAEIGEVIGWTASDAREHPEKLGSVGMPHDGVSIRLDRADTDHIGELLVRPPNRAVGYADGSDLDDRITDDGFVRTGDLARIDADGFVWIEGRMGAVINRGGNKVFPEEVEEVLRTVPSVSDVAVVAGADERLGEVPVAFIVGDASDAALDETCRRHLAPYKVPVRYERIAELPRNEVGKVLRQELT